MVPSTTVAVFVTLTGIAIAQGNPPGNGAEPGRQFEVASIKPAAPGSLTRPRWLPSGAADLHNVTVEELMLNAWRIFPDRILGAPAWVRTAGYDILAKPATGAKPSEANLMVQALLRDRFGLAIHHETRTLPVYALVMARKDGTLGPTLVESKEGGCVVRNPANPPPPPDPAKPATLVRRPDDAPEKAERRRGPDCHPG